MPEESKKIVKEFSEELKAFSKILAEVKEKSENINDENLKKLKAVQKKIEVHTRKYLEALSVDPKIIQIIDKITKNKYSSIGDALNRDFKGVVKKIQEEIPNKSILELLWNTRSDKPGNFQELMSSTPMETIKKIEEVFDALGKREFRALRLNKLESTEDVEKLGILWEGAETIADKSSLDFKLNLLICYKYMLQVMLSPISAAIVITSVAIQAVIEITASAVFAVSNLATLNHKAAVLNVKDMLGTTISALTVALAAMPVQLCFTATDFLQTRQRELENQYLNTVFEKVIAVVEKVDAVEKYMEKNLYNNTKKQTPDIT